MILFVILNSNCSLCVYMCFLYRKLPGVDKCLQYRSTLRIDNCC